MKNIEKSLALTEKFNQFFPGGHTNFKVPMTATSHRLFIRKAAENHVWDVDGNEYVLFNGGMGPCVLGAHNEEYITALKDTLSEIGPTLGSNLLFTEADIRVAELLTKYVPCAEAVKFQLSGTESVQMAIRLARAYTGKLRVLRFDGMYHGWMDNVMGCVANPDVTVEPEPFVSTETSTGADWFYSAGRSPYAKGESYILPWNDFERLETTFEKYHDGIAIIIMEPIFTNHCNLFPKPGFLERIRELCDQYNVVMCCDEIISGFRIGLGGAQEYLGVKPDIATLGKAISGGVPFSAVVGKKELLNQLSDNTVLGPGTYNGYVLGVAAVLATLTILERDGGALYKRREKVQQILVDGLIEVARKHSLDIAVPETPGIIYTLIGVQGERKRLYTDEDLFGLDNDRLNQFARNIQAEGIIPLLGGRWFIDMAHTVDDVEMAIAAADKAMARL
jgi:glutamate-1-semialdehyde 2,1-aminomutase